MEKRVMRAWPIEGRRFTYANKRPRVPARGVGNASRVNRGPNSGLLCSPGGPYPRAILKEAKPTTEHRTSSAPSNRWSTFKKTHHQIFFPFFFLPVFSRFFWKNSSIRLFKSARRVKKKKKKEGERNDSSARLNV